MPFNIKSLEQQWENLDSKTVDKLISHIDKLSGEVAKAKAKYKDLNNVIKNETDPTKVKQLAIELSEVADAINEGNNAIKQHKANELLKSFESLTDSASDAAGAIGKIKKELGTKEWNEYSRAVGMSGNQLEKEKKRYDALHGDLEKLRKKLLGLVDATKTKGKSDKKTLDNLNKEIKETKRSVDQKKKEISVYEDIAKASKGANKERRSAVEFMRSMGAGPKTEDWARLAKIVDQTKVMKMKEEFEATRKELEAGGKQLIALEFEIEGATDPKEVKRLNDEFDELLDKVQALEETQLGRGTLVAAASDFEKGAEKVTVLGKASEDAKREVDGLGGGLGENATGAIAFGLAIAYAGKQLSDFGTRLLDAQKKWAKYNVQTAIAARTIPDFKGGSQGLDDLRSRLRLTSDEAIRFQDVLKSGSVTGVVSIEQLVSAATKLEEAFGEDPTDRLRTYVELLQQIPTLETDLNITASLDDQAAAWFALAEQGKVQQVIEMQAAGLAGAEEAEMPEGSAAEVEALKTQRDMATALESIEKSLSEYIPNSLSYFTTASGALLQTGATIWSLFVMSKTIKLLLDKIGMTEKISGNKLKDIERDTTKIDVNTDQVESKLDQIKNAKVSPVGGAAAPGGFGRQMLTMQRGTLGGAAGGAVGGAVLAAIETGFNDQLTVHQKAMTAVTGAVGGGIGAALGGPMGAAIGAQIGTSIAGSIDWDAIFGTAAFERSKQAFEEEIIAIEKHTSAIIEATKMQRSALELQRVLGFLKSAVESPIVNLARLNKTVADLTFENLEMGLGASADFSAAMEQGETAITREFSQMKRQFSLARDMIMNNSNLEGKQRQAALASLHKVELEAAKKYAQGLLNLVGRFEDIPAVLRSELQLGIKQAMLDLKIDIGTDVMGDATDDFSAMLADVTNALAESVPEVTKSLRRGAEIIEATTEKFTVGDFNKDMNAVVRGLKGNHKDLVNQFKKTLSKETGFYQVREENAEALKNVIETTQARIKGLKDMPEFDFDVSMLEASEKAFNEFEKAKEKMADLAKAEKEAADFNAEIGRSVLEEFGHRNTMTEKEKAGYKELMKAQAEVRKFAEGGFKIAKESYEQQQKALVVRAKQLGDANDILEWESSLNGVEAEAAKWMKKRLEEMKKQQDIVSEEAQGLQQLVNRMQKIKALQEERNIGLKAQEKTLEGVQKRLRRFVGVLKLGATLIDESGVVQSMERSIATLSKERELAGLMGVNAELSGKEILKTGEKYSKQLTIAKGNLESLKKLAEGGAKAANVMKKVGEQFALIDETISKRFNIEAMAPRLKKAFGKDKAKGFEKLLLDQAEAVKKAFEKFEEKRLAKVGREKLKKFGQNVVDAKKELDKSLAEVSAAAPEVPIDDIKGAFDIMILTTQAFSGGIQETAKKIKKRIAELNLDMAVLPRMLEAQRRAIADSIPQQAARNVLDTAAAMGDLASEMMDSRTAAIAYARSQEAISRGHEDLVDQLKEQEKVVKAVFEGMVLAAKGDPAKLSRIRLQYESEMASLAKERLEAERHVLSASMDALDRRLKADMAGLEIRKEELDIQQDLANTLGWSVGQIFTIQMEQLGAAKQQRDILLEAWKDAEAATGVTERTEQLRLKYVRAAADVQKKALGAQRDAYDKLLDKAFGAIRSARGARRQLMTKAQIFGTGFVQNVASGLVTGGGAMTVAERQARLAGVGGGPRGGRGGGAAPTKPEDKQIKAADTNVDASKRMHDAAEIMWEATSGNRNTMRDFSGVMRNQTFRAGAGPTRHPVNAMVAGGATGRAAVPMAGKPQMVMPVLTSEEKQHFESAKRFYRDAVKEGRTQKDILDSTRAILSGGSDEDKKSADKIITALQVEAGKGRLPKAPKLNPKEKQDFESAKRFYTDAKKEGRTQKDIFGAIRTILSTGEKGNKESADRIVTLLKEETGEKKAVTKAVETTVDSSAKRGLGKRGIRAPIAGVGAGKIPPALQNFLAPITSMADGAGMPGFAGLDLAGGLSGAVGGVQGMLGGAVAATQGNLGGLFGGMQAALTGALTPKVGLGGRRRGGGARRPAAARRPAPFQKVVPEATGATAATAATGGAGGAGGGTATAPMQKVPIQLSISSDGKIDIRPSVEKIVFDMVPKLVASTEFSRAMNSNGYPNKYQPT